MLERYKQYLQKLEDQRRTEQEHMSKQLEQLEERLTDRINKQINNRDKEIMEYIRTSQQQQ